ncbi:MAG TPA: aromatic ring-hydroxylating dioxygenase subunit alpha [Nostocaceae cyanobacterium]|nr:aromatic ring-hydroxylating dioxygenase subunit alpha [Nostocaceae cyanobacterium]
MHITNYWYIACQSHQLKRKPLGINILGIPLVLFRDTHGKPAALLDRCPHRNIPLSQGWLENNYLVCKYHGWKFDQQGICQEIPGLCSQLTDTKCNATSYPLLEQDNFIWIYCQTEQPLDSQPYKFPYVNQPGFSSFTWQMQCQTTVENAAENFLDATHTHFVHTGLIRQNIQRQEITVKITRQGDMAEAVYLDEKGISGLIYKLLTPGCQNLVSIGRFILPSIAQLEYCTNNNHKLLISLFFTPLEKNLIQAYAVITFRWNLPSWLGKLIAKPLFWLAAKQDKNILELQTANINKFQEEKFTLTEIDILKPHIQYLLKKAANNQQDSETFAKTIKIKI